MPTSITASKGLIAPVPVDRIEIVNGPSVSLCMQAVEQQNSRVPLALFFTLMTAASERTFQRRLRRVQIFDIRLRGRFTFTAESSNCVVSGHYHPKTRQGWFNED